MQDPSGRTEIKQLEYFHRFSAVVFLEAEQIMIIVQLRLGANRTSSKNKSTDHK